MQKKLTSSPYISVQRSSIHGTGVFAAKNIPKGTEIIEYVGEKISKKESERRAEEVLNDSFFNSERGAVYIFDVSKKYDLDGNVPWNTARFVNHSCDPNCESINDEEKIWIVALRDIAKGEELMYNYGYDVDNYDEHLCLCGSKNCVGYIVAEDQWKKLRKKLAKKKE